MTAGQLLGIAILSVLITAVMVLFVWSSRQPQDEQDPEERGPW